MTEALSRRTSRPPLTLMVFVVGAASLGSEIAAARLLAPYFGASTTIWANTIAVVLLALSTGYWFGGRLADPHAARTHLSALVLAAALRLVAAAVLRPALLLPARPPLHATPP